MKGLSQKLKIIAPIGVTLLTLMGFQNCSGVNFEQAPIEQDSKSLSNEVDETNDPLLPVVSTPGISPPESIAPVYQKDIDVSPVSKKEGDLDIALIIDDSYSNVDNISRILSGVNDLVSSLAGKKFILSAFTIDRNSPYHLMTRRTRSTSDGWTISELIDGRPLAQLDSNGDKSQFLSTIQSHLNSIRNKAPGYDTTPSYACELLGYLHNKMVEQMSADKRHVILVISDENMGSPKNLGCLKSSGYKREAAPPRQMVTIPVQHQQRLEGGTFQWASTRINFGVSSCDQLTKEMIDQRLSSPAFRALPNTYTDCRPGTLNSTRITDSKYEYFFTSTGANNQSEPSSSFKDQLNQFYKVIPKTNMFFGSFTVLGPNDKLNDDQEVGSAHIELGEIMAFEAARRSYSIHDPNYSKFVSDVINFEYSTSQNRVDLTQFFTVQQIAGLKIVRVEIQEGSRFRTVAFSAAGSNLVINDASVDLSKGAKLRISYN